MESGYHVALVKDATAAFSTKGMKAAETNAPMFAHAISALTSRCILRCSILILRCSMSLLPRPKRSSVPANGRSPPGCITFTSATFTTWKTTQRIARRAVRCSSNATGTSLDATTLMSVVAVNSAMRGSQVASRQSPGSGDGTGCRCSSRAEERSSPGGGGAANFAA